VHNVGFKVHIYLNCKKKIDTFECVYQSHIGYIKHVIIGNPDMKAADSPV